MDKVIKFLLSSVATVFVYLLGGFDVALQSLLLVIAIDYVTGMLKATKTKKLSSKTGFKGIAKKIGVLCLVALSVVIDNLAGEAGLISTGLIRTMVIYYLVANEGLSVVENLAELDVIVPDFMKDRLEQLKNKGTDNNA